MIRPALPAPRPSSCRGTPGTASARWPGRSGHHRRPWARCGQRGLPCLQCTPCRSGTSTSPWSVLPFSMPGGPCRSSLAGGRLALPNRLGVAFLLDVGDAWVAVVASALERDKPYGASAVRGGRHDLQVGHGKGGIRQAVHAALGSRGCQRDVGRRPVCTVNPAKRAGRAV